MHLKLFFLFLSLIIGTGCTTTSSQTSTTATETVKVAVTEKAPDLSDVRAKIDVSNVEDPTLPKIKKSDLRDDQKIRIKMRKGFRREFQVCDADSTCHSVNLATPGDEPVATGGGRRQQSSSDIIAEVELSDEVLSLKGKPIVDVSKGRKILIMEPDVELSILNAGGLKEPNALWTMAAKNYVTDISAQYLLEIGESVSVYDAPAGAVDTATEDLVGLHEAVGLSVYLYQYPGIFQLPTKKSGEFNWQLGKTTKHLKDKYGADLGLFVYLRDSYASGSRVAAQLFAAALGVHVSGGQQLGFVSLVDLETGEIIWYNKLFSSSGDLRTFGPAFEATEHLLDDMPS